MILLKYRTPTCRCHLYVYMNFLFAKNAIHSTIKQLLHLEILNYTTIVAQPHPYLREISTFLLYLLLFYFSLCDIVFEKWVYNFALHFHHNSLAHIFFFLIVSLSSFLHVHGAHLLRHARDFTIIFDKTNTSITFVGESMGLGWDRLDFWGVCSRLYWWMKLNVTGYRCRERQECFCLISYKSCSSHWLLSSFPPSVNPSFFESLFVNHPFFKTLIFRKSGVFRIEIQFLCIYFIFLGIFLFFSNQLGRLFLVLEVWSFFKTWIYTKASGIYKKSVHI